MIFKLDSREVPEVGSLITGYGVIRVLETLM